MGACLLSVAAGALSLLSPCVLPLLPAALAGALERHRLGALALTAGLVTSATGLGFAFAALGFALDRDVVRGAAAGMLVVFGAVLVSARMDLAFSRVATPVASRAASVLHRLRPRGPGGQFVVGGLLGALWMPCGGPTLGTSISLAARRESLPEAAAVMAAYSVGAALPLLVLAYGSRRAFTGSRGLALVSRVARPAIGVALIAMGLLSLGGADKALEARLVERMPAWLVDLTTRF